VREGVCVCPDKNGRTK